MNVEDQVTNIFSKDNNVWNTEQKGSYTQTITWGGNGYVGGWFPADNLSKGYFGIMQQWWDKYMSGTEVLLVSDNHDTVKSWKKTYPNWNYTTLDYFPELQENKGCDINASICAIPNPLLLNKFNLIVSQATLEHVPNPVKALENMFESLQKDGILVLHTHSKNAEIHRYPRDYFRFITDFWYDLPQFIPNIELLELLETGEHHVFTCYRKTK